MLTFITDLMPKTKLQKIEGHYQTNCMLELGQKYLLILGRDLEAYTYQIVDLTAKTIVVGATVEVYEKFGTMIVDHNQKTQYYYLSRTDFEQKLKDYKERIFI